MEATVISGVKNQYQLATRGKFFTKFTMQKAIFYCCVLAYCAIFTVICFLEMFLPDSLICDESMIPASEIAKSKIEYTNPSFVYDPCSNMNLPYLLFLSRLQCNFGRRLLASGFLGGIVGWERREADRPAGIRTMALVSLGVCLFSINSTYAFWEGPMGWDASRVSAAIPSGVGFLGAGLIFKDAQKDDDSGASTSTCTDLILSYQSSCDSNPRCSWTNDSGITVDCTSFQPTTQCTQFLTSTFSRLLSVWHVLANYILQLRVRFVLHYSSTCNTLTSFVIVTVATILLLLRFGPRQSSVYDDDDEMDEEEGNEQNDHFNGDKDYASIRSLGDSERTSLRQQSQWKGSTRSIRQRPSLGGIV